MLTVLAVAGLVIVAIMAIPLTLSFKVSLHEAFQKELRVLWAFGLIDLQIPLSSTKTRSLNLKKLKPKKDTGNRSSGKSRHIFAVVHQSASRRRIGRYCKDVWQAIHKTSLSLHVRVGLGDPADTGQLWAILGPAAGILAGAQYASISIEPEFQETTVELDSHGKIRLIPLQLVYLTLGLLLSPTIWGAIKQIRDQGKK